MLSVSMIDMYYIQLKEETRSRSMSTDTVEWEFGNGRQIVGGSHNKLTALGFDRSDKKSNVFNAAKCRLVGNNKTGKNFFKRAKRH